MIDEQAAKISTRGLAGRIAFVSGGDDQSGLAVAGDTRDMEGTTDVHELLPETYAFKHLHVPRNYLRLNIKHRLDGFDAVVNLVTDPDQHPRTLDNVDAMLAKYKGSVINRPKAVRATTRDRIARQHRADDDLIVPRLARFSDKPLAARSAMAKAEMRFPAILRLTGTHNGRIVGIVRDADEVVTKLQPGATHLLIEFIDSRWPDGLFRKLRVFFFGGHGVLRHHLASTSWNVHASARTALMADRPDLIRDEATLIARGYAGLPERARAALETLCQGIGLDFIGVDFAILRDGRVLLFEANATMNFFPFSTDPRFAYLTASLDAAKQAFAAMMAARVVRPGPGAADV